MIRISIDLTEAQRTALLAQLAAEPVPVPPSQGPALARQGSFLTVGGTRTRLRGFNLQITAPMEVGGTPRWTDDAEHMTLQQCAVLKRLGHNAVRANISPGSFRYWHGEGRLMPFMVRFADAARDAGLTVLFNWWNVSQIGGTAEPFPWAHAALQPYWTGDTDLHDRFLVEFAKVFGDRLDVGLNFWDEPMKLEPEHSWPDLQPIVQRWIGRYRGLGGKNTLGVPLHHYGRDGRGILSTHLLEDPLGNLFLDIHEFGQEAHLLRTHLTDPNGKPVWSEYPIVVGGAGYEPVDLAEPPPTMAAWYREVAGFCDGFFAWDGSADNTPNLYERGQGFPRRVEPTFTAYGRWTATYIAGLADLDEDPDAPPVEPPVIETGNVVLHASATPFAMRADEDPWPLVVPLLDGEAVGEPQRLRADQRENVVGKLGWTVPADKLEAASTVSIRFLNDASHPTRWTEPGMDRNVYVLKLVVGEKELTPPRAFVSEDGGPVHGGRAIIYRTGNMTWNLKASVPAEPLPPISGTFAELLSPKRKRRPLLDGASIPWAHKPRFLRDIFVDIRRGDDGSDASETRPLRTLEAGQRRAQQLGPGTLVHVRDGVYDFGGGALNWGAHGRPDAWYGVVGYEGERPIIKSRGWDAVNWQAHYGVFAGFELDGSRVGYTSPWTGRRIESQEQFDEEARARINNRTHEPSGWDSGGGFVFDGGMKSDNRPSGIHHVICADVTAHHWPGSGIGSAGMDYVLVEDALCSWNCFWMGWGGSGISIFGPRDQGDFGGETYRIIVRRTITWENIQFKATFGQEPKISDGGGIQLDVYDSQFNYRRRSLVHGNLAAFNGQSGIHSTSSGWADYIGNTCFRNNQHPQNRHGSEMWVGWNSPDCTYQSNVLVSEFNTVPLAMVGMGDNARPRLSQNNVLFGGSTRFMGNGDIVADPLFVATSRDPARIDLNLRDGSPAIGRGNPLATVDLMGRSKATPDAGAFFR